MNNRSQRIQSTLHQTCEHQGPTLVNMGAQNNTKDRSTHQQKEQKTDTVNSEKTSQLYSQPFFNGRHPLLVHNTTAAAADTVCAQHVCIYIHHIHIIHTCNSS